VLSGVQRQTKVYLDGVSGRRPRVPVDHHALERAAERAMSPQAFAYIAGGAGGEATVRANRAGWDDWRIVPRMLRDVAVRDLSVELFGRRHRVPFMLAPIGVLEMAHRGADLAVARAAAAEGVGMTISSQASTPMEDIAAALGDTPRWFQLYWSTSNELVESFVSRAEASGCEAIAVTLDTTMLGWRTRDLDVAYLPFLRGKGIAQYTSDPVFTKLLDTPLDEVAPRPRPTPAAIGTLLQILRNYPGERSKARDAVQRFIRIYSRPSLTWADLPFLRERTKLPIVLKGILHPEDARRAVAEGVDGIWVSNHGGRQVDGAIATIEALPGIVDAVGGEVPVLLDSGVRGGADVFKALALGARAVMIGRPFAYGLAVAGEAGVREVIQNLVADTDLTFGLAGCASIAEATRESLLNVAPRA
jgi:lactate 2-monooxygenase